MKAGIWYFEEFDFHKILCPYKMDNHFEKNPPNTYHKSEFLFMSADPVQEIILIHSGKVKVGQYDEKGNESVFAFLGKGEILGQMALLGETQHRYFAEVVEEGTEICRMSIDKAKSLSRDYMPFGIEINRRINQHVRRLERRIEILLYKNVKTRLLEFLKDLACDYGQEQNGGIRINHSLTQNDIASLIGTSRKSASLLMNELERKGLIEFSRKHIFIQNLIRLNKTIEFQGI